METSTHEKRIPSSLLLLLLCAIFLISTTNCNDVHSCHESYKKHGVALFIFGDSLYDPGNNNYINTSTVFQANFSPYGQSFFNHPTGRFSDGRLICDFIAEYAKLPLIPAYSKPGNQEFAYGANFASSGAGALVETNQGFVIDLKTQLSNFKNVEKMLKDKLGSTQAAELLSRAVYLFSAGANDYFSPFFINSSIFEAHTHAQYIDMVIGNFTSVIKEIYDRGGRKFGFMTLPPLGCLPSLKAIKPEGEDGDCYKEPMVLTKLHNKALPKVLQSLVSELKGFKYAFFSNLYTHLSDRINHPSRYGFKEGKKACCGTGPYNGVYSCGGKRSVKEYTLCSNPDEYLFFDSSHLTERAYEQLAKLYWKGDFNSKAPYTLEKLFEHQPLVGCP